MRGRVRLHAVKKRASGGLEADDERRKSLAEKGWARRSVVMHELEAVPGREAYGAGDEGAARWAEDMLEYADDNFNDAGIEVRSLDQRERKARSGSSATFWSAWGTASSWSGAPTRSTAACTSWRW